MRVVVDASAFGAAFGNARGLAARVIAVGVAGQYQIIISEEILNEVRRLPAKPHIATNRGFDLAAANRLIASLRPTVVRGPLKTPSARVRDSEDEHVLAFALTVGADIILSQDNDLLSLGNVDGIPVMGVQLMAYTLGIRH